MPSRSDRGPYGEALSVAAARLIQAIAGLDDPHPVILLDGRSGSGKSTLAAELVARWPGADAPQLLALDSVYPGWDGLDEGARIAADEAITPHAREKVGVWRRYDWEREAFAESHAVVPQLPLIVEGVGALTPATADRSPVRVWLDSPAASRKRRALARDGDGFRPHWERWARQEERHIARNAPQSLVTHTFNLP